MKKTDFNQGWTVETAQLMEMRPSADLKQIMLPHDRTIEEKRSENADWRTGYWPGGSYKYVKCFMVPEDWEKKQLYFVFEGVYRDAHVLINDDFVCHHSNGYTHFVVDATNYLRYGRHNVLTVLARSGEDSRWYTGTGIYRPVYMLCGNLLHIKPYGVKATTIDCNEKEAVVEIKSEICSKRHTRSTVMVKTQITDKDGKTVAVNECPVTVFGGECFVCRQRVYLEKPDLWNLEDPSMYQCKIELLENDCVTDEAEESFGIRKISLDKAHGLRLNGKEIKLRGGAIHHDNGPIGAAAYRSAEFRKIRVLKEAGFNSVRIAHNPAGKDLLDACDYYGMLVMNEFADMWGRGKTNDDYAPRFEKEWKDDVKALVDSSYNHPSVIFYSIGNEIPDVGSPIGSVWGRRIAEEIRNMDNSRFTLNSINGLVGLAAMQYEMPEQQEDAQTEEAGTAGGDINESMTDMVMNFDAIVQMPIIGTATAESFGCVDVAGYNYMLGRYDMDLELYPDRIICGSETYPPEIDRLWEKVKSSERIIGDYMWTAMDYLGEVGIGTTKYGGCHDVYGKWPARSAGVGAVDLIGRRTPLSYYRDVIFGLRNKPYLAVRRPEHYGEETFATPWAWSDCVSCWTWPGYEKKKVLVEVYADADEVALLVNGEESGRKECGAQNRYKAEFEIQYQPGTLTAVAYKEGKEISREELHTLNDVELCVNIEDAPAFESGMLYYVDIAFRGKNGEICCSHNEKVSVQVEGADLIGLSSADPDSAEEFGAEQVTTFDGCALAVIRPVEMQELIITVTGENGAVKKISIKR